MHVKKVLIFSLAYYPRVGGAEVALKEITERIGDIEFDIVTKRFSPADAKEERIGSVQVHRVSGPKFLYPLMAARKAYFLHRARPYHGAWSMMSYMLFPIVLLRMAGVALPYVLTLQEGDPFRHMFGRLHILPFRPLLGWGFRHARIVQVISTYLAGWARQMRYPGIIEVIPNGVDVAKFSGDKVPHEGVVLVTSSRLVRKNGVDTVIRALPMLPGVQFAVLGSGPDEAPLKALAKEFKVEDRVHFRGHVEHADLPRHLHHADIFVRPSRSEGMGNSFIEAFAAGLPVIATQVGGLKDFITSDVAWPVRPDIPSDIATAVKDILQDPERARRAVERASALARGTYEWDFIAKDMREKVFAQLFV